MPSTYTTSLRLTLPATGELAGTWGTTVNAGVTSLAEAAIAGTAAVTMIDADYTLTAVNGSADQARNMFVTLTGTLSAARNVICPPVSKLYFVTNNTTGGYAITFKTLAGTGISVPNGQRAVVYCNGTDVLGGLTALDSLSLNGSLTLVGGTANGVLYLNGSKAVTSGSALTFDGTNLGIGVTSPSQKLDILGGIAVRAATSGANQDIIALRALNSDNTAYANAIYYANSHRWAYAGATEGMRLDSSGNLGLGVTPTYKLDVYGTGSQTVAVRAATSGDARFYAECAGTNSGWMQYTRSLQALQWSANGATQHMTLDSSGNLGLGVTPSAWLGAGYIDFPGNGYVGNAASYSGNTLSTGLNAYYGTGNWRYKQSSLAASRFDHTNGAFAWLTAPSGTAGNAITFTQAMTLDASSNLLVTGYGRFGGSLGYIGKSSDLVTGGAATDTALRYDGNNLVFAYSSTERMRLDSSGNLGIGTASPGYRLTVAGTAGAAVLNLLETGVRSWAIRAGGAATNTFDISDLTAGQTRLTLDSSGNLGLGVTPSAWISNTKAAQIGPFLSAWTGSNGSANISFAAYEGVAINTYRYLTTGDAPTMYSQLTGAHRWYTAPSGTAGNAITFTQAMTLDASGNLGLGVAPSAWSGRIAAQVYSVSLASPSGSPGIGEFSTNRYLASGGVDRYIYSAPAMVYQQDSGAHKWYTAPSGTAGNAITFTQAMTLDSSGNLGVGTVSPVGKLSVTNPGTGAVGFNAGTISSPNRGNLFYDTDGSGWDFRIGKLQSGVFTPQVTLNDSGNLGIGTSSPIAATGTTVDVAGASGASQRWRNNAGTSSAYLEVAAGATNFGNVSSTPITFVTAATERMRLDTSGNLGIGTTSPDVFSRGDTRTVGVSSSGTSSIGINAATGNAASLYVGVNGTRSGQIVGSSAGLEVIAGSSLPLSLGANFSTRVTISSAGDVGVGTTSPTSTLHVSGSFSRGVPVTKTSNFTLAATENWVIVDNSTSSVTATLPAPSSFPGRELMFVARYATGGGNLVSASSNVVQPDGTVTAVIIPYDVAGRYKFSTIVSDGTNWVVMNRGIM